MRLFKRKKAGLNHRSIDPEDWNPRGAAPLSRVRLPIHDFRTRHAAHPIWHVASPTQIQTPISGHARVPGLCADPAPASLLWRPRGATTPVLPRVARVGELGRLHCEWGPGYSIGQAWRRELEAGADPVLCREAGTELL